MVNLKLLLNITFPFKYKRKNIYFLLKLYLIVHKLNGFYNLVIKASVENPHTTDTVIILVLIRYSLFLDFAQ